MVIIQTLYYTWGREKILKSLASSYLYKDLLTLKTIKKPVLHDFFLALSPLGIAQTAQFLDGSNKGIEQKKPNSMKAKILYWRNIRSAKLKLGV